MTAAVIAAMPAGSQAVAFPRRTWAATAVSVLFAGLAMRMLVGDWLLARVNARIAAGDPAAAAQLYRQAQAWQAYGPHSDLWYSRALAKSASAAGSLTAGVIALKEGYAAARRAPTTAEDPHNAYFNLATYSAVQNDIAGVEANLRNAIRLAPNWFKPHWVLARALQVAGRYEEAEAEATVAAELDRGIHPEVTATLLEVRSLRAAGKRDK
jgi:tetratricopeptide (TPR) repeat protein